VEIQALQKEISIHNQIDANLDVVTDKNKVATVIRNLISNAIKYSIPRVLLPLNNVVDRFIKITVTDNGIGINKEEMHNFCLCRL
jgi:signal transduction histidine kinase